ncbi:class I adenylate-forming enzyme family protein [Rhizobium phaseoli]|uniref:class I adenylate-forming enzyme family protein n=1 Tax=Rhizobium phaseoli TaxID=396 RepID=UPI001CED32A0|nr:AMP-binding protein [Rhizobium phaseoli]MDK4727725.1 AMP-binding protein [Rhizobium phaseoli]
MAHSFSGMASPADCGLVQDDPVLYRARVAPDRQALFEIATGRQLTYAELDRRIARCAGFLVALLGVRRDGARVAMLARNSVDSVVLAFACQRAGAIYVPLNWRLNAAELVGGAPLTQTLIESYLDDGVALVNGYGMSEAGTVLHVPIDRRAVQDNPGSVGLPAPLLDIRIVGEDGRDVGEGEIGEFWLRGPAVTSGYWNKPRETAAAFTDGWYRTGDLGRREANGFYRIVDRLKDMYIIQDRRRLGAEFSAVVSDGTDTFDPLHIHRAARGLLLARYPVHLCARHGGGRSSGREIRAGIPGYRRPVRHDHHLARHRLLLPQS